MCRTTRPSATLANGANAFSTTQRQAVPNLLPPPGAELRRLIREGFEQGIAGEQLAEAAGLSRLTMAAAAHRYSSTVAVERMSRRAVLTDPRKAYTADRTQTAIMTINIGSQLVRL